MNDLYGTEPWPLPELKIPSLEAWKTHGENYGHGHGP